MTWLSIFIVAMSLKTIWNRYSAEVRVQEKCALGFADDSAILEIDDTLPFCKCVAKTAIAQQSIAASIPIIGQAFYKPMSKETSSALIKKECLTIGRVFR